MVININGHYAADGVPPDGTPMTVIDLVEVAVTVIQWILTTITVVFIVVCLGFNIIFRNRK